MTISPDMPKNVEKRPPYGLVSSCVWLAVAGAAAGMIAYAWLGASAWWGIVLLGAAAAAAGWYLQRHRIFPEIDAVRDDAAAFLPLVRNLFERLPDPVMLIDMNGRATFANRAMREVVGTAVEHKHVSALLRMPSVLSAVAETIDSGEPSGGAFTIRVPVERHFEAHTVHIGFEPASVALLLHDLTAIKRAEQMRVDFVANASHELRTPLAAVTGFIETLKGPARDDPEARDAFLDIMLAEGERMRRLIDDLLSLSRIEMNEHVVPQTPVPMAELVENAAKALQPLADADGIKISISAEAELPDVAGERDELAQLMQNLLHNAVKYGRENGHVTVRLRRAPAMGRGAEAMVAIAVEDDGEGIPPEAIPRLTERFYRVDVKRSREKGGTGLGLAIVKHIVNRHGGKLQIESRIGEGSTFTVLLPAVKPSAALPGADAPDGA